MALASLLTLLDDIATVLDDVALMTKAAAQKSAGVLGDDLAVNAEKVIGVRPERELPVVWGVAKGSMLNKGILVPAALLISVFAPWLITPLLVCGGLFLCFEGAEKVLHWRASKDGKDAPEVVVERLADPECDLVAFEKEKIKGAIRTDFILSAEIIVLTLGVVEGQTLITQVIVLSGIATLMTVGVYGLVAGIVKLDDLGMLLSARPKSGALSVMVRGFGRGLVAFAPWLMRGLTVVGTLAMFLVGGGILTHASHDLTEFIEQGVATIGVAEAILPTLISGLLGLIAGVILVFIFERFVPHSDH